MKRTRRSILKNLAAFPLLAVRGHGQAQTKMFPSKPLTIIVDFPAGGPADTMGRAVAQELSQRLAQPAVVLNKPGGASQIAAASLLQLPADGHAMMLGNDTALATNEFLYKKLAYVPNRDFAAVAPMFEMPMVLWVPTDSPFQSLEDLLKAGRSRTLNYGSVGTGSTVHLLGEELKFLSKAKLNHVPYRGSGAGMLDLLASRLDFMFDGVGAGLQYFREGKLRGLVAATPARISQLPEVPTSSELNFPSLALSAWFGIVVSAGTPQSVIDLLSAEVRRATSLPQVADRFLSNGFLRMDMSPREFGGFIAAHREKISRFIRRSNISLD